MIGINAEDCTLSSECDCTSVGVILLVLLKVISVGFNLIGVEIFMP